MSTIRAALVETRWISIAWSAFIAENLIVSENRDYIIDLYNEKQYHTLYNALSSAACAGILYAYMNNRRRGPVLPPPGIARKAVAYVMQTTGFIGLSQLMPRVRSPFEPVTTAERSSEPTATPKSTPQVQFRCPMDFRAADVPADGIYLMDRVTRHPSMWFVSLVSMSAAMNAVYASQVAMYSFPLVFAYIGGWHQDRRHLRGSGGFLSAERYAATSNVPFVALFRGKQTWKDLMSEIKTSNLGVAFVASSLVFILRKG